jgi:hypothetical protein
MTGFAFAAALALCGGTAIAADQLLTGKKVLIKNPPSGTTNNKIVFLSKDTDVAIPGAAVEDPRCAPDGTATTGNASAVLTVTGSPSGEDISIPLVCDNWTVNGAGNLFKYKDTSGATCKIVLVKDGKLVKAVCKGTQVSYDLGAAETNVNVVLRTGPSNRYCVSFNASAPTSCTVTKDGSDGKTLLLKNCTGNALLCGASPSGAFVDGASLF